MDQVPSTSIMTTHSTTDFEAAVLPVEANQETELVHLPFMCRYTSKRCYSVRAIKRNGKMHNLCELHRVNANNNQRRLELRRRLQDIRGVSERVGGRCRASTRKSRSSTATAESPVPCQRDHNRTWKAAAAMTVEDMAQILADDADSLCQGLRVDHVMFPLHDVDSSSSSSPSSTSPSCTSDTDDSDDTPHDSPMPRFSGWGPRHSLDFCEADAEMAIWVTGEALGLDAVAGAPWSDSISNSISQATDTTSGWTNDAVTLSFTAPTFIL
jgi:hypothetical protein